MPFDGTEPYPHSIAPEDDVRIARRLLAGARTLIEEPDRWEQGAYEISSRRCAVGALHASCKGRSDAAGLILAHEFLLEAAMRRGYSRIESMNDRSSHEEVLSAFDEAIDAALAKAELIA